MGGDAKTGNGGIVVAQEVNVTSELKGDKNSSPHPCGARDDWVLRNMASAGGDIPNNGV